MRNSVIPSLDAVLRAPEDRVVPVYWAFPSDTETPISAFLKLRRNGTACLLESAEHDGRLGRYSFIGVRPDAVLRADVDRGTVETEQGVTAYRGSVFDALRDLVGTAPLGPLDEELPGFVGGAVGLLGYDVVQALERVPAFREPAPGAVAMFARYRTMVVFDHLRHRMLIASVVPPGGDREQEYRRATARVEEVFATLRRAPSPPPLELLDRPHAVEETAACADRTPGEAEFREAVARAREYILAGDAIQVVLSRRLTVPYSGDPFRLYRALRMLSPSPYMFYLEFPDLALVGASPEMLLRVADGAAQVAPIAGTRARGVDPAADQALGHELAGDPKERAEHVMLVDLGRNDLSRVCRAGSVHVASLMKVERFSHVMHLVSTVTGRLREDVDALAALAACFPAGTVTGAPKVRAMEIIAELEDVGRGPYAGAVGYVGFGGTTLDTCIAIRTVVVRSGAAHVQTGAGIVADSDPQRELMETSEKARAMLAALADVAAGGARRPHAQTSTYAEVVR